jgi:transcriptional pleiotropic regulator of transition state genes
MDFRKALEISDWDELHISLEKNNVIIRKATDTCTFCGSEEDLTSFEDKFVCKKCLESLKTK